MQYILFHGANLANMTISVRSEWSYVGEQQFLNFEIRRIRPKVFMSIIHRFFDWLLGNTIKALLQYGRRLNTESELTVANAKTFEPILFHHMVHMGIDQIQSPLSPVSYHFSTIIILFKSIYFPYYT